MSTPNPLKLPQTQAAKATSQKRGIKKYFFNKINCYFRRLHTILLDDLKSFMLKFKQLNNIFGWLAFAIATITYALTMEPTASYWDCGEFISAAYKLQVVHPPGAPMFLLIERLFAIFAGSNISNVAFFTNLGSGLSSSFTILFLFWSITMLAAKLVDDKGPEYSTTSKILIFGSGLVGALAYTFSDTFWFSAVETEVYAMSSLCTAVVFWAILKWENIADERHSDRWLVFISLIVGLSIGVHLLNLLAIPAIAFVYYFKRFKTTTKGLVYTSIASIAILGFIQFVIIPGIISTATKFDLLFVNGMGMPFWTGAMLWFIIVIAAVVLATRYSIKKGNVILHTAMMCLTAVLIGYSSYTMIPIRAKADPNINMYANDNIFNLLSYINREQYGETPLLTGQYFTAKLTDEKEGSMQYAIVGDKYVETGRKTTPIWEPVQSGFFPRMWSNQANHISFYKSWASLKSTTKRPSFGENISFFVSYQMGHMYWRYFMWNFAGRQNDIQGHGNITDGNWLSGIKAIDEYRLGPQSNLPDYLASNTSRNELYFLPLILGILGLVFHFRKNIKDASVVGMLFFFTGLAIVIYLNQYPYQPRERDYAYVGSFYAFSLWIGLGVLGIYELIKKKLNGPVIAFGITTISLLAAPVLMAATEWDDHDRSNRTVVKDFAADYLNSCAPNAVLFTMGDNETYPLWYAQEVEGIRTDVRVVNLSLLGMDWYINQMKKKTLDGTGVPFTLSPDKYTQGTRDYIPYYDMKINGPADLKEVVNFVTSTNQQAMMQTRAGKSINVLPTRTLRIKIDKSKVMQAGVVSAKDSAQIVDYIDFTLNKDGLVKNDLMVLDLLANNIWDRPIYFAATMGQDNYYGLNDYLQLEGLALRLIPIRSPRNPYGTAGRVNTEIMYDNIMNKFKWGNMSGDKIFIDPETARMTYSFRIQFFQMCDMLLAEGKKDSCLKALDLMMSVMPKHGVPLNYKVFDFRFVDQYYRCDQKTKGDVLANNIIAEVAQNLDYYKQYNGKKSPMYADDVQQGIAVMNELARICASNNQVKLSDEITKKVTGYQKDFAFLYNTGQN